MRTEDVISLLSQRLREAAGATASILNALELFLITCALFTTYWTR